MSRKRIPYIASFKKEVEPLHRAQRRDLRHAEARAVVRQADVAPELAALLVERLAHDPEILLRGVSAAETFGRRAVRNVIQQRLRRAANHRDRVRARLSRGLGLDHVVVDVSRRDDHIKERAVLPARHRTDLSLRAKRVALFALRDEISRPRLGKALCAFASISDARPHRQLQSARSCARRPPRRARRAGIFF